MQELAAPNNCEYDSSRYRAKRLRKFVAGTLAGNQVLVPSVPHPL